jgi:hypothetical protein
MLIVKSIEIVDVGDRDHVELSIYRDSIPNLRAQGLDGKPTMCRSDVIVEAINGTEFISPAIGRVYIGWSKQVEKAIGVPLEVIRNQQIYINRQDNLLQAQEKEKTRLVKEVAESRKALEKITNLTFWGRVKFTITGSA